MIEVRSVHFDEGEFCGKLNLLAVGLLRRLFAFRVAIHPRRVMISPAAGAIVRPVGRSRLSQHMLGRAIDIMLPDGPRMADAFEIAKGAGFTGVGIYPDWKPHPGLHVDIRVPDTPGHVAVWGAMRDGHDNQVYISVAEALVRADQLEV